MPDGPRLSSWSPRWTRSADSAWDTAGSLTPSALAAAVTEPSLATRTKAVSCGSVKTLPVNTQTRTYPTPPVTCPAHDRSPEGRAWQGPVSFRYESTRHL